MKTVSIGALGLALALGCVKPPARAGEEELLTPQRGAQVPASTTAPTPVERALPGMEPKAQLPMGEDGRLARDERQWSAVDRYNLLRPVMAGRERVEELAARTGLPPTMVKRWNDLATNLGRTGLISAQTPQIRELVNGFTGSWVLVSRVANGRRAKVNATMDISVKEMSDSGATLQVLLREDGILESVVSSEGDNSPYSIGAYFDLNVGFMDDNASPDELFAAKSMADLQRRKVDPAQAFGVATAFMGEIVGTYQPYKAGVSVRSMNTFMKMGESYTTVSGSDTQLNFAAGGQQTNQTLPDFDWNYIQGFGDRVTYGSTRLNIFDTYRRVNKTAAVRINGAQVANLREYWDRAKRDFKLLATDKTSMPAALPSFYEE